MDNSLDEKYDTWLSRVEQHLQMMVKKSISELKVGYDYRRDYDNKIPAETTAGRVIKRAYKQKV